MSSLTPYSLNARIHSDKQIDLLTRSIKSFGFVNPVLIDRDGVIIGGHGRYEAAMRLGLEKVPVIELGHLSEAEVKAYRIADNRIAELSEWDENVLRLEIQSLVDLDLAGSIDFEVNLTGFDTPQIDLILDPVVVAPEAVERLNLPEPDELAITQTGDIWTLGEHRLVCGDALSASVHASLLGSDVVRLVFTDPPYNVPIQGHVRSGGKTRHREFAMGVGEMTESEFRSFLKESLRLASSSLVDGAVLMVCMDWRHIEELVAAGKSLGLMHLNICVWNKRSGAMGSLYRSKHEFIGVFRFGREGHVNNVELGRHGRNRTNVWDYAGVNTFRRGRAADLADHPTVKPTALIADALRDVTHRGDIVLDPFGGSGSTLLAAQKTGRIARLIELDPLYVDVAIRRWQAMTGGTAVLARTGESFATREAAATCSVANGQDGAERSVQEAGNDQL